MGKKEKHGNKVGDSPAGGPSEADGYPGPHGGASARKRGVANGGGKPGTRRQKSVPAQPDDDAPSPQKRCPPYPPRTPTTTPPARALLLYY